MNQKESNPPKAKPSVLPSLGIPEVLRNIHLEKASEPTPIKLQLSLKNFLKKYAGAKGISGWVREVIIKELKREAEETG